MSISEARRREKLTRFIVVVVWVGVLFVLVIFGGNRTITEMTPRELLANKTWNITLVRGWPFMRHLWITEGHICCVNPGIFLR